MALNCTGILWKRPEQSIHSVDSDTPAEDGEKWTAKFSFAPG